MFILIDNEISLFYFSIFVQIEIMDNNDIMKKLRVALQLRNDDISAICALVGFKITPSELTAIFRNADDARYKPCGDQLLRNFLNGLIIHKRGIKEDVKSDKK